MRNIIASVLIILASLCMAVMGTTDSFGWFLVIPVSLSSTALALAIMELAGTQRGSHKNGSVRLHISGDDPADQHGRGASHLWMRTARPMDNQRDVANIY